MTKKQILQNNQDEVVRLSADGVSNADIGRKFGCSGALVGLFLKNLGMVSQELLRVQEGDLTKFKDEIIKRFEAGQSVYSLARDLGISDAKTNKYLIKWGYDTSAGHKKHAGDVELNSHSEEIIRIYLEEKIGVDAIAKRFNTYGGSIRKIINDAGAMRDYDYYRYDVDQTYFEKIDTRSKAYFLGLLMSDGNVQDTGFRISLKADDREILEKLAIELNYEGGLEFIKPRHKLKKNGEMGMSSPQYRLSIHKNKIAQDLIKLGCMKNKTWKLRFPTEDQVPREFIADFLRGYCDGDGTISSKYPQLGFIGNKFFITELINYLPLKMEPYKWYQQSINPEFLDDPDKELLSIRISLCHGSKEVLNFLYGNCQDTLYLPRKYELAQRWLLTS